MKKLLSTRTSNTALSAATFILRVGVGGIMLAKHGYGKLMDFSEKSQTFADPFGIGSSLSIGLVVFAEFFCAALIILGLFTRPATIPLIIAMTIALGYSNKWDVLGKGTSAAIFLICFVAILLLGPGRISLDRFIGK